MQMPSPKLMVMVSFCWKMNFLPSEKKNRFKLTIKVVAFFLGHPVCIEYPIHRDQWDQACEIAMDCKYWMSPHASSFINIRVYATCIYMYR